MASPSLGTVLDLTMALLTTTLFCSTPFLKVNGSRFIFIFLRALLGTKRKFFVVVVTEKKVIGCMYSDTVHRI